MEEQRQIVTIEKALDEAQVAGAGNEGANWEEYVNHKVKVYKSEAWPSKNQSLMNL